MADPKDIKDLHRAGLLDVDLDVEPMPLPELSLAEAEDLWLSVVCSSPTYADYSRIQDVHLTDRGRVILGVIRRAHRDGWARCTLEHLSGETAGQVNAAYWSSRKKPPKVTPELDLGDLPRRLHHPDPLVSLGYAEDVLLQAWAREKYAVVHAHAAQMVRDRGITETEAWLSERKSRIAALTGGVRYVSIADVMTAVVGNMRKRLDPSSASKLLGTNFPELDRRCSYYPPGRLTILAGWNGHGKSTAAVQIGFQAALTSRERVVYISGEDELTIPGKRILQWTVEDLFVARRLASGQPASKDTPDGYTSQDVAVIESFASRLVRDTPFEMVPAPGWSLDQIEAAIVDAARNGAKLIIHDYLGCIPKPERWDIVEWRAHCIERLKTAATVNGAHLILLAQLKRPPDADETKPPNRYMIEYCPGAEQKAEYVVLAHRPQKNKATVVDGVRRPVDVERASFIVDKAKDGHVGTIDLGWDNARACFSRQPGDQRQVNLGDRGYDYSKKPAQQAPEAPPDDNEAPF